MEEWTTKKLSDCCKKITSGGTPLRRVTKYYENGTIPWVKTGELKDSKLFHNQISEWITDDAIANSSAKLFPKNTILMAMYGDGRTIGSLGILQQQSSSNQACSALISDEKICIPLFLFYTLQVWRLGIVRLAYGGAQRNLTSKLIQQFQIPLPPLSTQQKIAKILSAYDDLIENNLKRIKLLEEMAQITYEQWFVRMKFPNYETTPIDTETGLPEGWSFLPLNQSIHVNPTTKPEKGTKAPFVPMGSLSTNSMTITNIEERIPSGGAKFINGDTLVARITPCLENGKTGYVNFLDKDIVATGSTEFIVLRSTELTNKYFIYCVSRSELFRELSIRSMAGSDGRQRVNPKVYSKMLLTIPTKKLMDKFEGITQPMFDAIHSLVNQNIRLKEARDILLPRLMTGMIDVDKIKLSKSLDKNIHTAPTNIKEAIPSEC